jgi:hypothetical protein
MEDWDSEKMERQSVNGLQVTSCRLTPYDLRLTISGRDEDRGLEKKYVEGLRIAAPRTIQYRASLSEPWAIRARGLRLEATINNVEGWRIARPVEYRMCGHPLLREYFTPQPLVLCSLTHDSTGQA